MGKRRDLLAELRAYVHPKLQMIANGSDEVNAARAEQCAGLQVSKKSLLRKVRMRRTARDVAVGGGEVRRLPARGKLTEISDGVRTNVFVYLNELAKPGDRIPDGVARAGNLATASLPLSRLRRLADDDRVAYVEMGEPLKPPTPTHSTGAIEAPTMSLRRFGRAADHAFGAEVLVGIVDVQGFDFSHPDFTGDDGGTRFVAIWDQGGDARRSPRNRRFRYGALFTAEHLNAALHAAPDLGVSPWDVERQSQVVPGSHGTHVASIAAGNRGICRRAEIAGVLVSLPQADQDRRRSFYDSTRIADAVDWLVELARQRGKRLTINISLGTNGHAHDGSGAIGRWIDSVLATPGRVVTVAAGNAGQESGETPDDLGWISGRVHASGKIPSAGLATDLEWVVVGNRLVDVSENEMEIWYSAQDRFRISLRAPSGAWIGPVGPREFIENLRLPDGSFVSIYNELYHPANGANHVGIYLSPNLRADPVVGVPAGTWVVRIEGDQIRDGRFDAWIERDDPRPVGSIGPAEAWAFPSFFSERSMADHSTVSSLGCGHRVITVANLDVARGRVARSSSQGPTRDGRPKPDIGAPGTNIVAARGFSPGASPWIGMSGTSMASPFVTGVAGLMLGIQPGLTAAQIEGIMRSTAKPLPGGSFAWANDAGFGEIDPEACLEQAARVDQHDDVTGA
jgi:subtilisin family serine protease